MMKASLSVAAGSILEAKKRKLRLVLVDDAGKVGRCRRRHLRLSEQLPFEPDRIEIIVG